MAAEPVARGLAPTESLPAASTYGRGITDADVASFVADGFVVKRNFYTGPGRLGAVKRP